MVKANELRLGNIVERRREAGIVISLNREDMWIQFGGEWGDKERRYYEDIEGVDLTPEILAKCGFERSPEIYWAKITFVYTWLRCNIRKRLYTLWSNTPNGHPENYMPTMRLRSITCRKERI